MFNTQLSEHEQILFEASQNIKREKEYNKNSKKDLMAEISNQVSKKDRADEFYEPYDSIVCEGKLKIDLMYYQQLMKNLDEEYTPYVEGLITDVIKNVREIYEFINIKPEVFGRKVTTDLLNESTVDINNILSQRLYESIDSLFYKLTQEQRIEKYKDISENYITELTQNGLDSKNAITIGIKSSIMENVLTRISFPFTCWTRVKYLTESNDYGMVFDQNSLIELVENFENKIKKLSKITATCV